MTVSMRPGGPTLVVTDLDGTIWDERGIVHPETRAALEHLERSGIPVLAATARRPSGVLRLMASNDILLPSVLFDGCLGRDFRSGSTFHLRTFDEETAAWVLEGLRDFGIEPCVNVDDPHQDVVVGDRPSSISAHLRSVEDVLRRGDLDQVVRNEAVMSFIVCGRPPEYFRSAARLLVQRAAVSISRDVTFGGTVLSVRPNGVSKWEGVVSYCAVSALDAGRVLAVGDGENDLELLAGAAVSCAVEGSSESVLAACEHRVRRPEVGGWAEILRLLE